MCVRKFLAATSRHIDVRRGRRKLGPSRCCCSVSGSWRVAAFVVVGGEKLRMEGDNRQRMRSLSSMGPARSTHSCWI